MILSFIVGIILGSFANVLIYRIPKNIGFFTDRSRCIQCNNIIKFYHNIPILSYIFLKGRCAYCNSKISIRYPLTEIASGFIFVVVYLKLGVNYFSLFTALSFYFLLILSVIDIQYKEVPDSINFLALLFGIFSTKYILFNLQSAFLVAGGFVLFKYLMEFILKKEALGEADIIVSATIAAILGEINTLKAIFIGSVVALPFAIYYKNKKQEDELPFVPFLFTGAFIVFSYETIFQNFKATISFCDFSITHLHSSLVVVHQLFGLG